MENRAKTLIFLLRHFDQKSVKTTILISHFLHFGALKLLTDGNYLVLGINKITYSKQKMGCFIHVSIFTTLFPLHVSPSICKGLRIQTREMAMDDVTLFRSR